MAIPTAADIVRIPALNYAVGVDQNPLGAPLNGTLFTALGYRRLANLIVPVGAGYRNFMGTVGMGRASGIGAIYRMSGAWSGSVALMYLAQVGPDGYRVRIDGTDCDLQRANDDSGTDLGGISLAAPSSYAFAILANADGVAAFASPDLATWTTIASSADATYTGTFYPGIESDGGVSSGWSVVRYGVLEDPVSPTTPRTRTLLGVGT